MYLIARTWQSFEFKEDKGEETDNEDDDCHLIVAKYANDEHDYGENQYNDSPYFKTCLYLLDSVYHYMLLFRLIFVEVKVKS